MRFTVAMETPWLRPGLVADPFVGERLLQGVEDVIGQGLAVGHATIPLSAFLVVSENEWFVCIGLNFFDT